MPPVMPLNLALVNLAASVCEDQEVASEAYASAMGVAKGVLDAELARLVPRILAGGGVGAELAFLALSQVKLFLRRQRLLLEPHAMGRRDLSWESQRSLLRAMQVLGVESLAEIGEVGDAKAIIQMVGPAATIQNFG